MSMSCPNTCEGLKHSNNNNKKQQFSLSMSDMHLFFCGYFFNAIVYCSVINKTSSRSPWWSSCEQQKKRLSRSFSFQFSWKSHALKTCVCIYFLSPPSCLCKKLRNLAIFKIDLFSHAQKVVKRKSESEVKTRTWSRKLFKFSFWSPSFPP